MTFDFRLSKSKVIHLFGLRREFARVDLRIFQQIFSVSFVVVENFY